MQRVRLPVSLQALLLGLAKQGLPMQTSVSCAYCTTHVRHLPGQAKKVKNSYQYAAQVQCIRFHEER